MCYQICGVNDAISVIKYEGMFMKKFASATSFSKLVLKTRMRKALLVQKEIKYFS